jgi:hypothetical protein
MFEATALIDRPSVVDQAGIEAAVQCLEVRAGDVA